MGNLLLELKNRLNITWNEEDSDLENILKRAKAYFRRLTGKSFSFAPEDEETELLYERCRYVYNNAADEFEKNFEDELKRLILHVALEKRKLNGTEENP